MLRAAPTPQAAARLTPRRVVTLLKQAGRRNDEGLAEKISTTLRAAALRQPAPVEHALGVATLGLVNIITAMSDAIAALEAELATVFDQHAQATVITSFPGLGPVLCARVLGEIGDDSYRFTDARGLRSFAGTAPITRASGRSRVVLARRIRPVAIRVFAGNTARPAAFIEAVDLVRNKFELSRLTLIGDRRMITSARVEALKDLGGLSWITCLRAPAIAKLAAEDGPLQLSLFDAQDLAEIAHPDYPGERLIACRNPVLAAERARKRQALLAATETALAQSPRRWPKVGWSGPTGSA